MGSSFLKGQILPPCAGSPGKSSPPEDPTVRLGWGCTAWEGGGDSSISRLWQLEPFGETICSPRFGGWEGKECGSACRGFGQPEPGAAQGQIQAEAQGGDSPCNGQCSPLGPSVLSPPIAHILLHMVWGGFPTGLVGEELQLPGMGTAGLKSHYQSGMGRKGARVAAAHRGGVPCCPWGSSSPRAGLGARSPGAGCSPHSPMALCFLL